MPSGKKSHSGSSKRVKEEVAEGDSAAAEGEQTERLEPVEKKPKVEEVKVEEIRSPVPPKKTVQRRNDRNQMAHPKGAYVIRMQDRDTEREDHLWRVDNHQLLQYYSRLEPNDDTKYQRTNRYTGWFCSEDWKYMAVTVKKKLNKEEEVVIEYPKKEKIDAMLTEYKRREQEGGDDE